MIIRDVRLAERRSDCGWEVSDDPSATRQGTVFSWRVGEFGVPVMPSRVSVPKGRSVEDCLGVAVGRWWSASELADFLTSLGIVGCEGGADRHGVAEATLAGLDFVRGGSAPPEDGLAGPHGRGVAHRRRWSWWPEVPGAGCRVE